MKKNIIIFNTAILSVFIYSSISFGFGFWSYENKAYNYRIIIPNTWKKVVYNHKNKHVMQITKDKNTGIKVKAIKSKRNIDNIIHDEKWNLRKNNSNFKKIIETKKIKIKGDTKGRFLVYEYRSKWSNYLHRSIVTKNNGIIYIVECKSPIWSFYKVEDIFTTAMASFSYISSSAPPAKEESIDSDELIDDEEMDELEDNKEIKDNKEEAKSEEEMI